MKKSILATTIGLSVVIFLTACGKSDISSGNIESSVSGQSSYDVSSMNNTEEIETSYGDNSIDIDNPSISDDSTDIETETDNIKFSGYIDDDGTYTITDVSGFDDDSDIVFPKEIDGIPVSQLSLSDRTALLHSHRCHSVTVPGTIKTIWDESFYDWHMEYITLEEGICEIGGAMFRDSGLETIVFPEGCRFGINNGKGVPGTTVLLDKDISDVYLPYSVADSLTYDLPFLSSDYYEDKISSLKTTVHIPSFDHIWSPLLCQGYKVVAEDGSSADILGKPVTKEYAYAKIKEATGIDFEQWDKYYSPDNMRDAFDTVHAVEKDGYLHIRFGKLYAGLPSFEEAMEALDPYDGNRSELAESFRNRDKNENSYLLDWFDEEDSKFKFTDYVFPETGTLIFATPLSDVSEIYAIVPIAD